MGPGPIRARARVMGNGGNRPAGADLWMCATFDGGTRVGVTGF